jgi:hypothetical protein
LRGGEGKYRRGRREGAETRRAQRRGGVRWSGVKMAELICVFLRKAGCFLCQDFWVMVLFGCADFIEQLLVLCFEEGVFLDELLDVKFVAGGEFLANEFLAAVFIVLG